MNGALLSYLLWSAPIIAITVLIIPTRSSAVAAGLAGATVAAIVALSAAPNLLTAPDLLRAMAKGLWLCWLVALVILAGLFFRGTLPLAPRSPPDENSSGRRRRKVFTACFIVGPFVEAATGFGVGQVAALVMLRAVGVAPLEAVVLGLLSQALVPWGAMANGTMIGAALSGLAPNVLGVHSAILAAPLLAGWLFVFWRLIRRAGIRDNGWHRADDCCWAMMIVALLVLANRHVGPEIAGMAALGPLLVLRFWRDERPNADGWRASLPGALPYAGVIVVLVAIRANAHLSAVLSDAVTLRPFEDGPPWSPVAHPATWLVLVGIAGAAVGGHIRAVPIAAAGAWRDGRKACATIAAYLVTAKIMADSGSAAALADGMRLAAGAAAPVAAPVLAGAMGFITGSSNAANGLLMSSQLHLATDVRQIEWIAALQNTGSAALTMLSPARVAMGCALVGRPDLVAAVYRRAWPLGAASLLVLCAAAAVVAAAF